MERISFSNLKAYKVHKGKVYLDFFDDESFGAKWWFETMQLCNEPLDLDSLLHTEKDKTYLVVPLANIRGWSRKFILSRNRPDATILKGNYMISHSNEPHVEII